MKQHVPEIKNVGWKLVTANAGILIFSIYFAESFYLGQVHIGLIVLLGIVAGLTAIGVLFKAFIPVKDTENLVLGKILKRSDYPTIWQFTDSVAEQVGCKSPDNIIAGMEPTFFVTEAKITCLDGKSKGRTLFSRS